MMEPFHIEQQWSIVWFGNRITRTSAFFFSLDYRLEISYNTYKKSTIVLFYSYNFFKETNSQFNKNEETQNKIKIYEPIRVCFCVFNRIQILVTDCVHCVLLLAISAKLNLDFVFHWISVF